MWTYFVQCAKLTFFLNYDFFSLFSILRIPSIFHFILLCIIQSPYTLLFTIGFSKRGQPDSWWGQPDFYQQVARWATLFFLELLRPACECLNCHTDTILSHKSQAKLNTYILCNTWCFSVQLSLKYKEQMDMFCATHLLPFSFLVCAHAHIILGASEPWELNWLHFKGRKRCLHYFISLYASIERREALLESRFYDQRDVGVTKKAPISNDIVSNVSHNRKCNLNIVCTS